MRPLIGQVQPYAWGSRTAIAALRGLAVPSAGPEAELWLGGHPQAPSRLDDRSGPTLPSLIERDPVGVLGRRVADTFGARLPYLMKILAADAPLSLQAHPDQATAAAAYARHHPGYTDPYHKPELLVALDEFEALCGFRAPDRSAELLASLEVAGLAPVVAALRTGKTGHERLRGAVTGLLALPERDRTELVAAVAATGYPLAARLAADYPGDVGVLLALLLNEVRLAPGEAVFMPAGNPHAYLRGLGVEIMAASDNVLRGGLTVKRVDVPELLRVLRFEVLDDPVRPPGAVAPGLSSWPVPVADFALCRAVPEHAGGRLVLPPGGPRVLLCTRGTVTASGAGGELELSAGTAAFVPAGDPAVTVRGWGDLFQASVPVADGEAGGGGAVSRGEAGGGGTGGWRSARA